MIAPAGPEAAEALAALHAEAFAQPWSAAEIARLFGVFGVFALAVPDGFILLQEVLDEAEVLTLAVRPAARRRGVARALVDAGLLALAARGVETVRLEVAADNAAAQALYRAAGFEAVGRRRGYYARPPGPPVDALVMRRRLNTSGA